MQEQQKVVFLDLKAQFADIQEQVIEGIQEVCQNAEFVLGSTLKQFEQNFSNFLFGYVKNEPEQTIQKALELRLRTMYQSSHCVGVGNGTDALEIALRVLDLPPKSEILVPANAYFACVEAIVNANLVPVIVDCDEDGIFKPNDSMISKNTRAILAVHLYGTILDLVAFEAFAKKHQLKLIEDCAQAHGGIDSQNRRVGSVGDIACFSFYPCKNLGAYGDGGAIVSKDLALVKKVREFANHGLEICQEQWIKNHHIMLGRNSRLDAIQAVILNIKLTSLDTHNAYRAMCAREYYNSLKNLSFIKLPNVFAPSVWHLFVIQCQNKAESRRDELLHFLQEKGIECGVHYPCALSDMEVLKTHPDIRILPTPNASHRARNIISLPIGEHLNMEHIDYIAAAFKEFEKNL